MGNYNVPVSVVSSPVVPGSDPNTSFYITNVGSIAVYLSDQPQLNTADGTLLNIGSSIQWQAGSPCYAICSSASVLSISNNTSGIFDPQSIASRISAVGVPPIDIPNVIYRSTVPVASGVSASLGPFDVSKFTSVTVIISESGTYTGLACRPVDLIWSSDPQGFLSFYTEEYTYMCQGGGFSRIKNATGPYLNVYFNPVTTTVTQNIQVTILGSYRDITSPIEYFFNGPVGTSGTVGDFGSNLVFDFGNTAMAVGASITDYPLFYVGPATMVLTCNQTTTGGNVRLLLQTVRAGQTIAQLDIPAGNGGDQSMTLYLPRETLLMKLTNGSSTANVTPHGMLLMGGH